MIKIKHQRLAESLERAINQGIVNDGHRLFSYTEQLSFSIDTVNAFASAYKYKGSRFFWTNPEDNITFIGIGTAYMLQAEQDRFFDIENEWKRLLEQAYIENPYELPGTGPMLIGGFSFDPVEKSKLWENYDSSRMVVPQFLIMVKGENAFITYNMLLQEDVTVESIVEVYEALKKSLKNEVNIYSEVECIAKQDVLAEQWKSTIRIATDRIRQGEMDKVVLARELKVSFNDEVNVPAILSNLIEQQKQSYIFAIESGNDCFIGATPERLVKVEANELLSTCLAGTAPRGNSIMEDEQIGQELLTDEKNMEEHAFVVRMIKNAVEACCSHVEVPDSPILYKLKNLQHLYTPVKGKLSPGYTLLDVVKRLHPTPAMGGVPRQKALDFIREEEVLARGWYAAPIGWMDANGNGEFAVAIRSGLIKGDEVSLFAGCGIVKDSNPEIEFTETEMKFRPMLMALGE